MDPSNAFLQHLFICQALSLFELVVAIGAEKATSVVQRQLPVVNQSTKDSQRARMDAMQTVQQSHLASCENVEISFQISQSSH